MSYGSYQFLGLIEYSYHIAFLPTLRDIPSVLFKLLFNNSNQIFINSIPIFPASPIISRDYSDIWRKADKSVSPKRTRTPPNYTQHNDEFRSQQLEGGCGQSISL